MYLRELAAPLSQIKGAGPAAIRALAQAGITTQGDLLAYYPRDWEDRSRPIPLGEYRCFPAVCTVVRVLAHDWFGPGAGRTLKVYIEDESARGVLVCFNRPFLEKQLLPGKYYRLWGRFYYKFGEIQSASFEFEALEQGWAEKAPSGAEGSEGAAYTSRFGAILPVYPLAAGLTQALLRRFIRQALDRYASELEDELPEAVLLRDGLLRKAQAVRSLHFPASLEELTLARRTVIAEELFYLEILVGIQSLERRKGGRRKTSASMRTAEGASFSPLQRRLMERLPFTLTAGQRDAVLAINQDLSGPYPMARLLQGDVGSGKTLVSFLAALRTVEAGEQAALLAPTELLARQHSESAAALLEPLGIRPAFLTGNIKAAGRSALLKNLAAGEIDVVVGTHALFSRDVIYHKLGLVVVDEQHRFGVTQRQAIMAKGDHPDLLMMSATPIPRTLTLTLFGDMAVSVIRDLPPGRRPVKTHLAKRSGENRVYEFVRKELAAGRQAYFVYPLVEEGNAGLKDAESMAKRLAQEIFPGFPAALIHARLDEEEKRKNMDAFRRGDIRVLAATSVVEVGVDVPNASCMVIEQAERFGLAALHQLRGRVGRGADQSYCFLLYADPQPDGSGALTEDAKARLRVMMESSDGFVIAEEDLKLRGPGHIAGIEQSGYLKLGLADLVRDTEELAKARLDAFSILEKDPELRQPEHRRIALVLERAPPFARIVL
ncbi:MAG: ATP-dependent DNA helicase RecG [Treponema sp.]|jgi:ATP-dependent DNA helicase RecG|nr:ATP-dependent DNA helicase RecG [Treponema sp.]